jgi:hypothetical protein
MRGPQCPRTWFPSPSNACAEWPRSRTTCRSTPTAAAIDGVQIDSDSSSDESASAASADEAASAASDDSESAAESTAAESTAAESTPSAASSPPHPARAQARQARTPSPPRLSAAAADGAGELGAPPPVRALTRPTVSPAQRRRCRRAPLLLRRRRRSRSRGPPRRSHGERFTATPLPLPAHFCPPPAASGGRPVLQVPPSHDASRLTTA